MPTIAYGFILDQGTEFEWDKEPHDGDFEYWWKAKNNFPPPAYVVCSTYDDRAIVIPETIVEDSYYVGFRIEELAYSNEALTSFLTFCYEYIEDFDEQSLTYFVIL